MKVVILAAATCLFGLSAQAAERPVPAAQLKKLVTGKSVGAMSYGANGRYTYNGGSPGQYEIFNGQICVKFDNGGRRCDSIVTDGSSYTLINSQGRRFPFNP